VVPDGALSDGIHIGTDAPAVSGIAIGTLAGIRVGAYPGIAVGGLWRVAAFRFLNGLPAGVKNFGVTAGMLPGITAGRIPDGGTVAVPGTEPVTKDGCELMSVTRDSPRVVPETNTAPIGTGVLPGNKRGICSGAAPTGAFGASTTGGIL
jgi:hypothetical protein